jgi:hypothetical protein
MFKKKILGIVLAITMSIGLWGCGSGSDSEKEPGNETLKETTSSEFDLSAGDFITFGSYEQDNDLTNGQEPIRWLVLDVKDGKALVISRDNLDIGPYNSDRQPVTWETSTAREWLNTTFFNTAFTEEEKALIPTVTITEEKRPYVDTDPGNPTEDKVFLLSVNEFEKYVKKTKFKEASSSMYLSEKTNYHSEASPEFYWWLRTPGENNISGVCVDYEGRLVNGGYRGEGACSYRPVIWVEITSELVK